MRTLDCFELLELGIGRRRLREAGRSALRRGWSTQIRGGSLTRGWHAILVGWVRREWAHLVAFSRWERPCFWGLEIWVRSFLLPREDWQQQEWWQRVEVGLFEPVCEGIGQRCWRQGTAFIVCTSWLRVAPRLDRLKSCACLTALQIHNFEVRSSSHKSLLSPLRPRRSSKSTLERVRGLLAGDFWRLSRPEEVFLDVIWTNDAS